MCSVDRIADGSWEVTDSYLLVVIVDILDSGAMEHASLSPHVTESRILAGLTRIGGNQFRMVGVIAVYQACREKGTTEAGAYRMVVDAARYTGLREFQYLCRIYLL